jgi:hypothetical protein
MDLIEGYLSAARSALPFDLSEEDMNYIGTKGIDSWYLVGFMSNQILELNEEELSSLIEDAHLRSL